MEPMGSEQSQQQSPRKLDLASRQRQLKGMLLVNEEWRALPVMRPQQVMVLVCPHHHPQAVVHLRQVVWVPVIIHQQIALVNPQLVGPVVIPQQIALVHPQLVGPVIVPNQLVVPVVIVQQNIWICRKHMVNQKSLVQ